MVKFLPFKALLPFPNQKEPMADRVSPPYDVIDDGQRIDLQSHPHNIARITLGAKDGTYDSAAEELRSWLSKGALKQDSKPSYYVYRQTFEEKGQKVTRTGIIGRLELQPYEEGGVIPHEETFPKIKEDRLNLLRATSAHLESIFCIFEKMDDAVRADLEKAVELFSVVDGNGVKHDLAKISEASPVKRIEEMLAAQKVLIADGHHRYETALRYHQENPGDEKKAYVLATMIATDDPGLVVLPTHRLFGGLKDFSTDYFLSLASKEFGIWELKNVNELLVAMERSKRPALGFLTKDGKVFMGELLRPRRDDVLSNLDTSICENIIQNGVLATIANTKEVKADYDHSLESVVKKMSDGRYDLAVVLSPPRLDVVWSIAKSGKKMPKKSTYFWPKIWSGFVIYDMS